MTKCKLVCIKYTKIKTNVKNKHQTFSKIFSNLCFYRKHLQILQSTFYKQILDFHEIINQFWELNDEVYILLVVTTFTMKGDYPGITGIKYNKYLYLVSWPRGQDELTVRVEGQTVDLCGVGVHNVTGLGRVVWPCVPSVKVKHILRSLNTRHY